MAFKFVFMLIKLIMDMSIKALIKRLCLQSSPILLFLSWPELCTWVLASLHSQPQDVERLRQLKLFTVFVAGIS